MYLWTLIQSSFKIKLEFSFSLKKKREFNLIVRIYIPFFIQTLIWIISWNIHSHLKYSKLEHSFLFQFLVKSIWHLLKMFTKRHTSRQGSFLNPADIWTLRRIPEGLIMNLWLYIWRWSGHLSPSWGRLPPSSLRNTRPKKKTVIIF